jgi:hypothetical protein
MQKGKGEMDKSKHGEQPQKSFKAMTKGELLKWLSKRKPYLMRKSVLESLIMYPEQENRGMLLFMLQEWLIEKRPVYDEYKAKVDSVSPELRTTLGRFIEDYEFTAMTVSRFFPSKLAA